MKSSAKYHCLLGPLVMFALVLAGIFSTCGPISILVAINAFQCISILIIWLLSGGAIGRLVLRERSLFGWVSRTSIGIGLLGLLFHLLGLAGGLNHYSINILVGIGAIVELILTASTLQKYEIKVYPADYVGWIILSIPLVVAIICASVAPGFLFKPLDPHPYDVMSYHLQIPREWYDAGRIIPLEHNAFSFFPMLMETHYLAAMHVMGGPWQGMYLCQFISLAHGVLMVLAIAGLLIKLNINRLSAWSLAALASCVPWVLMLSTVCYVEAGVMLYGLLGLGWIVISIREKKHFAIAGSCLGLACGFKYTAMALTLLPATISLLIIGLFVRNRRWIGGSIVMIVIAIMLASPWLIRNIIWTKNPVFPLMTSTFGRAHFTEDQLERYQAAHQPPLAEASIIPRLQNGWNRTFIDPQCGYVLIPVALASLLMSLRKLDPAIVVTGILLILSTAAWLFFTHDMPRFLSPNIPILVLLIGLGLESYRSISRIALPTIAAIQMIFGLLFIWPLIEPMLSEQRRALVLLPDFTQLVDPAVEKARAHNQSLDLVGDAQAFFYCLPSSQLQYRSVFDVNIIPGQSMADSWLGKPVDVLKKQGDLVIVREDELDRLSRTYKNLLQK